MYSSTTAVLEKFDNQHDFERMAADILNALGYSDVIPIAPRGGSDGGQDITFTTESGGKGLACVTLRKDSDKKFNEDFSQREKGDFEKYIFITNQYLTADQKKKYIRFCLEQLDAELVTSDIEALRSLLDTPLKSIREHYLHIPETSARFPKLGFGFSQDGKIVQEIVYSKDNQWCWQDINTYVQEKLSSKRSKLRQMLARGEKAPSKDVVQTFQKKYEKYLERLQLALKMQFVKEHMPQCRFEFILFNEGNISANDVAVFLTFPEGSAVIELNNIDEEVSIEVDLPPEPDIPQWAELPPPDSIGGILASLRIPSYSFMNSLAGSIAAPSFVLPGYSRKKTYDDRNFPFDEGDFHASFGKVGHFREYPIALLAYLPLSAQAGLSVKYSIISDELLEPMRGQLTVKWA